MKKNTFYIILLLMISFNHIQAQQSELTNIDFFDNVNSYQRIVLSNDQNDDYWFYPRIKSYCIINNELYVFGNFKKIDNVKCEVIAKYDGTSWKQFGNASTLNQINNKDHIRCIYGFNGELYLGTYEGVKKWNGTNWVSEVCEKDGKKAEICCVNHFCVYNNQLYASSGEVPGGEPVKLFRLEGSVWKNLSNSFVTCLDRISNLTVFNNSMYISGIWGGVKSLFKEDGVEKEYFLEFNGTTFKPIRNYCPEKYPQKGECECYVHFLKNVATDNGIYTAWGIGSSNEGGVYYWDGKSYTKLFSDRDSKSIVKFNNFIVASTYKDNIALIENGEIRKWVKLPLFDPKDYEKYDYPELIVYNNKILFTVHE